MTEQARAYIAIDLKSFYASVECVERHLDPLTTNLVVADEERTTKTICLAVSPSLKAYGIRGRARLFEVVKRVRELNNGRKGKAPEHKLTGKSFRDTVLRAHPDMEIDYITATPRMAYYIEYSTRIYNIYLKYVSPDDIHVYSIDEVFIDATPYLLTYQCTAHELAMRMIRDVLTTTGITATAGIGTNMYLCKIAMDIVAKHIPPDNDGVRIAELNERTYRRQLWGHRPITDFWRVGGGTARRLASHGMVTMGDVARQSVKDDELLYSLFGVNAELLIDHAWGWESCTIRDIKRYSPKTSSISNGQVLTSAYTFEKGRVVVREMADTLAMDLLDKRLMTDRLTLTVGYDAENISNPSIRRLYTGETTTDHYGRTVPKHAHGTTELGQFSSSARLISDAAASLYDRIVNRALLIRRINVTACDVTDERTATRKNSIPVQLDLFNDEGSWQEKRMEQAKEKRMQETILRIKKTFGKNAILKGLNYEEGATGRQRNEQIGGHKA